jgi:hypothetical protein
MPACKKVPNMLLLGSAGRNSGKTLFACTLIRRFSSEFPFTGVKVTTIHEQRSSCPRGGKGCGVCTSLDSAWVITEECDTGRIKDTSRLLASGARKVFWLRVSVLHLEEGLRALLERLPRNGAVICESNSARLYIHPGLFFILRAKGSSEFKDSAREAAHLSDRLILFDPERMQTDPFDPSPDDVSFEKGRWVIRNSNTAHPHMNI